MSARSDFGQKIIIDKISVSPLQSYFFPRTMFHRRISYKPRNLEEPFKPDHFFRLPEKTNILWQKHFWCYQTMPCCRIILRPRILMI